MQIFTSTDFPKGRIRLMCIANMNTLSLMDTTNRNSKFKKFSEEYPCSNFNKQGGTVSHDEMNL